MEPTINQNYVNLILILIRLLIIKIVCELSTSTLPAVKGAAPELARHDIPINREQKRINIIKRGYRRDIGNQSQQKAENTVHSNCVDKHELCSYWASEGECAINSKYMFVYCPNSCLTCEISENNDFKNNNYRLDTIDETKEIHNLINQYGVSQESNNVYTLSIMKQSISYMKKYIHADKPTHLLLSKTIDKCKNKNSLCSFWASIGQCEKNKAFMVTNCAPACKSCHLIEFKLRCPERDDNMKPGLIDGELNDMFERIIDVNNKPKKYTVNVYSRPSINNITDEMSQPWLVTIDKFLTPEECNDMIHIGYQYHYERSKDVGDVNFDRPSKAVLSAACTSENSWCSSLHKCRDDPFIQNIHFKIESLTGISANNSEDFQILKYEVGQYYAHHHDYIPHQKDRLCGSRILTLLMYLNDVEKEGGTNFNDLNITVGPKRGRVVLWPCIINDNPTEVDNRTKHAALEVKGGVKYAANAWIHLYDHVKPQKVVVRE